MENLKIFGSTLKQRREARGKSVKWIADRMGRSSSTVAKWEAGEGNFPEVKLLGKIARVYRIPPDELRVAFNVSKAARQAEVDAMNSRHGVSIGRRTKVDHDAEVYFGGSCGQRTSRSRQHS